MQDAIRKLGALALALFAADSWAGAATQAGTVSLPEPTLRNLSIVWPINGDDDLDGEVSVRYRKSGSFTWREGMPLRRVAAGNNSGFNWGNAHRGSIFGLLPGTTYEIELRLFDPDGGSTQRLLTASTRPIPVAGDGPVRQVTPDTLVTATYEARPGEIIQLTPGDYGPFQINQPGQPDGTENAPITIRGTAGAVITGEVGIFERKHWRLENLTVEGRIRLNGSDDIAVVGCTVNANQQFGNNGIVNFTRAERNYIAGNTVVGSVPWEEQWFARNSGDGIAVTGPGHVIENNSVSNFRDGISFMEDSQAVDQFSIDVQNNRLNQIVDDAVEADFCVHNCRVIGNRVSNSFISFSAQPSLGGPTYFIRNQAYSVAHLPFKLYRGSNGVVILHNTIVKHGDGFNSYTNTAISNALVLNNLFLGGPAGNFNGFFSGKGRVVDLPTLDASNSRLDYNGYGTKLPEFTGTIESQKFNSVTQMRSRTTENNGLRVDYDVFAGSVAYPASPTSIYAMPDLTLSAGSDAVDRGVRIKGINDDYEGSAPDLGALERSANAGKALFSSSFE